MIAIFDIGKTNKKLILFDERYQVISEGSIQFKDIRDHDGFLCEDINAITEWILNSIAGLPDLKAINFSAYGASFVHVDEEGRPVMPLYNYLRPFPKKLLKNFYNTNGEAAVLAKETASPVLGSLNSGLQLYRLKKEKPEIFKKIYSSLHLPQFLSSLITKKHYSELTSTGCHTMLWDFNKCSYHEWVAKEGLLPKLPGFLPAGQTTPVTIKNRQIEVGIGLHDSSAALIPYQKSFSEPFILLSTGTWCISLNPFNHSHLTEYELQQDCLCYLDYKGNPVKASRLFAGREHEEKIKELSARFSKPADYYKSFNYDPVYLFRNESKCYEGAYHHFIMDLVLRQAASTRLILNGTPVKTIFVDGGFSKNNIYMNLLASTFRDSHIKVYASEIGQSSALGAAIVMHDRLNNTTCLDGCSLIRTLLY